MADTSDDRVGDAQASPPAAVDGDVPLLGGLSTPVVLRRGGAVHRTAGPWTPTIHRLLDHLHGHGVAFVPRVLGMDEAGREVLTYLSGRVPTYPMPSWVWSTRVLTTAARQLAQVHAATRTFLAVQDSAGRASTWQEPERQPAEVVCLNDVGPYNMVFSDGLGTGGATGDVAVVDEVDVTGWIDVDKASPGPRVWDLAQLAHRLVPLASADYTGAGPPDLQRYGQRLRRLCVTYGMGGDGVRVRPADVVGSVSEVLQVHAEESDHRFAAGALELAGHGEFWRDEHAWLTSNLESLLGGDAKGPVRPAIG